MNDPASEIIDEFLDDPKVVALALAVTYWGLTNQNPNTNPASVGTVKDTANQFLYYLQS